MGKGRDKSLFEKMTGLPPETDAEQAVMLQFRRVVSVFAHLMLGSTVIAWLLTDVVFMDSAAALFGIEGDPLSAATAWGLLVFPLFVGVSIGLLMIVVYARSLQARTLPPEETDRMERRAAFAYAPLIVASGLVTVVLLVIIGGDIHLKFSGGKFEEPVRTAFHEKLTDIWGLAVAPAAGATGLVGGTVWKFDIRWGIVLGVAGAAVALLLYFETVPAVVSALGLF